MLKILLNNKFIGAAILVNTLVTILLVSNIRNPEVYNILNIVDNAITMLFIVEMAYKLYVYKKDFFKRKSNIFDLVLVLLASIPLFFAFSDKQPIDLNYILILRIFKLFKFIRFGKFIPNFGRLLRDFGRAVKASISLMIGAMIMMIIISTILTYVFKDAYPMLFGNPFESAYNIFRMLTIEGWYEIPDFMVLDIPYGESILIRIFFSIFVFAGGMLGMSFFTSLIVDELASDNNDKLMDKMHEIENKLKELTDINKELMDRLR